MTTLRRLVTTMSALIALVITGGCGGQDDSNILAEKLALRETDQGALGMRVCDQSDSLDKLRETPIGRVFMQYRPMGGYARMLTSNTSHCGSWHDQGTLDPHQRAVANVVYVFKSSKSADEAWKGMRSAFASIPSPEEGAPPTGLGSKSFIFQGDFGTHAGVAYWRVQNPDTVIVSLHGVGLSDVEFRQVAAAVDSRCRRAMLLR